MAITMPWGEEISVLIQFGFPTEKFTLDSPTLGVLDVGGFLDGTLLDQDITQYVEDVSISRGRPDQLQQNNAGTSTIVLNNNNRFFDPVNEASPYWNADAGRSGVVPRRLVKVLSDGEPLFTGRITDVDLAYQKAAANATSDLSTVTITAADDFVLLANTYTESAITPTEELSGARVEAILDLTEVAYPNTRDIETGTAILGGGATYAIDANTNVLTYLQNVATAEQGFFYISREGDLVFTNRAGQTLDIPSAYFADDGTELPYTNLEVIYGQEFLYNKVLTQVIGGTEQVVDDAASQTEYGISTLALTDLLLNSDAAALDLATDLLDRYKQPQYRFDRLRAMYNGLGLNDRTALSTLDLGKIVSIKKSYVTGTPSTVTQEYTIESVQHTITADGHIVQYGLSYAVILAPLILDDPVFGQLDATNALAAPVPLEPFVFDISEFDAGFAFS